MDLSIVSIFAGGLLTFASPCVLPLIPVYLATLAGGSIESSSRGRLLVVASAFAAGLSAVFVAMGALASTFGGFLTEHRLAVIITSGVLMTLFGLRALGVFRPAALDRDARPALAGVKQVSTVAGAFVFGAAFAFGWSPCIGPVLASVLTYAATHADTPWRGAGLLGVYAAGLSLPLLLVAVGAARASSWLRRMRGALPKLERATGFALIAVGLWTLGSGVWPSFLAKEGEAAPLVAEPSVDGEQCDSEGAGVLCGMPAARVDDEPGDEQALLAAEKAGPRILQFTAHTCPVCERMQPVLEKVAARCEAFRSPHSQDARTLSESLVTVDVATQSGRALADRHAVRGTPTYVLLDEQGRERGRILGERSEQDVMLAVEDALGASCADPASQG